MGKLSLNYRYTIAVLSIYYRCTIDILSPNCTILLGSVSQSIATLQLKAKRTEYTQYSIIHSFTSLKLIHIHIIRERTMKRLIE